MHNDKINIDNCKGEMYNNTKSKAKLLIGKEYDRDGKGLFVI